MILANGDLWQALESGRLVIDPRPPRENFSTCSVDLRVGGDFWKWRRQAQGVELIINCSQAIIPDLREYAEPIHLDSQGSVVVPPKELVLGRTLEVVHLPPHGKLAARVEGRSTLARLGLGIHITAPTIHSGFSGPIVLEFMNHGPHPLRLEAGRTCICQLIVEELRSEPVGQLNTVFQNQTDAFGKR